MQSLNECAPVCMQVTGILGAYRLSYWYEARCGFTGARAPERLYQLDTPVCMTLQHASQQLPMRVELDLACMLSVQYQIAFLYVCLENAAFTSSDFPWDCCIQMQQPSVMFWDLTGRGTV